MQALAFQMMSKLFRISPKHLEALPSNCAGEGAQKRTATAIWLEQLAGDQSQSVAETICDSGVLTMTASFFQAAAYLEGGDPKLGQKLQVSGVNQ